MGNDDAARDQVVAAGERGRRGRRGRCRCPSELRHGLDSPVADIANIPASRCGGMLVAGLFLRRVRRPRASPWAHLDIAGPACNERRAYGYTPKGGDRRVAAARPLACRSLEEPRRG